MRIVGHQRPPAHRALAAHDPVVAADVAALCPAQGLIRRRVDRRETPGHGAVTTIGSLDVRRLEAHRCAEGIVERQDGRIEARAIDDGIEVEPGRWARMEPLDFLEQRGAVVGHEAAIRELLVDVAEEALVSRDDDVGGPASGRDPEHTQLGRDQRGVVRRLVHVGVDALDKCTDNGCAVRMIAREFGGQAAAVLEEARSLVTREFAPADDLRHGARRLTPPHFELEGAVACGRVALREEEVVLVCRVDVRNAPAVAEYLHPAREPRKVEGVGARGLRRDSTAAGEQGKNYTSHPNGAAVLDHGVLHAVGSGEGDIQPSEDECKSSSERIRNRGQVLGAATLWHEPT